MFTVINIAFFTRTKMIIIQDETNQFY